MAALPKHTYDESKLPQWAQRELQRLRNNVEHWRTEALAGPEDSNTFIRHFPESTPLGDSPTIEFMLGEHHSDRIDVRLDKENECICVSGGDSIQIHPASGNMVHIKLGRWRG